MAETPQGSEVKTPKDTHGLNLQIPKKYTETLDNNRWDALKQNSGVYEKEINIDNLRMKLRVDAQKLSAELNIPLDRWSKTYRPLPGQDTLQKALEEKPKNTQSRESPLSNEEWIEISRQNIKDRVIQGVATNNISSVVDTLTSLSDYQHIANNRWMNEWLFVEEIISIISKSDLKEAVLGVMRSSLEEIKKVRATAQRLDNEMKSKPTGSQIQFQDLNQDDVSFIGKSSLAGLFLLQYANPILDKDFFAEKTWTPPGRLPWLQRMYEHLIQSMEKTNQK